jgi:putative transposase
VNYLPKKLEDQARKELKEIHNSGTIADANVEFDKFINKYQAKWPKAVECLQKDRYELLTFYQFPAEHWESIRTTNPIESSFATIRHRTKRSKNCLTRTGALSMIFKLAQAAENNFNRIKGFRHLENVMKGTIYTNGQPEPQPETTINQTAA